MCVTRRFSTMRHTVHYTASPMHRDKEQLEKDVQDALEMGQEEARQRTVAVGRYELTLDVLAGDLQETKEKLAKVCPPSTTG